MTLKRFYFDHTNSMVKIVKKLFYVLKDQPANKLSLKDASALFKKRKHNELKIVTTTNIFNEIFNLTVSL